MNARHEEYLLTIEQRQVKETVSALFHTLLLHRTLGKIRHQSESNYKLGSIGTREVDCESLDLTYVRVNSSDLSASLSADLDAFVQQIGNATQTKIALEFYQKRKRQWPLPEDLVPWEVWQLNLNLVCLQRPEELNRMRETVADAVSETILNMCSVINRPHYLPKMPTQTEMPLVFDPRFALCQPYLFRVIYQNMHTTHNATSRPTDALFSNAGLFKKLLKDTLSL